MKKNILIACDSFKGSLSSKKIGLELAKEIKNSKVISISDGGEGFIESILLNNKNMSKRILETVDDQNKAIKINIGIVKQSAYLDIASIMGLNNYSNINGTKKTTIGLGKILKELEKDPRIKKVYIGLGGSSTIDGGFYASLALGFKYLNENNDEIIKFENILEAKKVAIPKLKNKYIGLSDVKNQLLGENGSLTIFGSQKGLTAKEIAAYEKYLNHYSKLFSNKNYKKKATGAAGGLGYFILNHLNGGLKSGIKELIKISNIKKDIKNCKYLITGEGKFDYQSFFGKAPIELAKMARKNKSILVAGIIDVNQEKIEKFFKYNFQLKQNNENLSEAIKNTLKNLKITAKKINEIIYKLNN